MMPKKIIVLLFFIISIVINTVENSYAQQIRPISRIIIPERLYIRADVLYVLDQHAGYYGTIYLFKLDNTDIVDQLRLGIFFPPRYAPMLKMTNTDIYISDFRVTGPENHYVTLERFALNDFKASKDHFYPSRKSVQYKKSALTNSEEDSIKLDPLGEALWSYHTPKLGDSPSLRKLAPIWHDVAIPGDGFYYLYILDHTELVVWRKSIISTNNNVWEKIHSFKDIPGGQFWVSEFGKAPLITTESGKIYSIVGSKLNKIADSFALLEGNTKDQGDATKQGFTFFIDDLDSGNQWVVRLDSKGKVLTKAHHLRDGDVTSQDLPDNLSDALGKMAPLLKK